MGRFSAVSVVIAGAEPETGDTLESLVLRAQTKLMTAQPGNKPEVEPESPNQAED